MKMLKSKNIRRICVLLAMLAPVVYLFGSLFAGLTGAHGTQVFADYESAESVEVSLVNRIDIDSNGQLVTGGVNTFASSDYYHFDSNVTFEVFGETSSNFNIRPYFYDSDYNFLSYINMTNARTGVVDFSNGYYVRFASYFVGQSVTVLLTGFDVVSDAYLSAVRYSDYVFGQFFAKDNFLEQIGKDVLSDNPHGFVPFASFWKYLDENMLHMGNMQLGLMGYGYVYYCCHVLLFDIAFILVTFFLDFIQKVNDKVVGGVD